MSFSLSTQSDGHQEQTVSYGRVGRLKLAHGELTHAHG